MSTPPVGYRIRWGDDGTGSTPGEVLGDVDTAARTVTLSMPGGQRSIVDVVTARALTMMLSEVVYAVLQPDGPFLAVEARTGTGWVSLREVR